MLTIESLDSALVALGLFAPGFIILVVRAQFLTGRMASSSESALLYVIVSSVYYAFALLFVKVPEALTAPKSAMSAFWFGLVFLGPALFGIVLGLNTRFDVIRNLLRRIGLNPVHSVPTAWDWKFSRINPSWVLVTLKDDTQFSGVLGFTSSEPNERDLFIEQVYDIDDNNVWTMGTAGKSVLILAGEIRTIEFWPKT
jgi:hypothetical protein